MTTRTSNTTNGTHPPPHYYPPHSSSSSSSSASFKGCCCCLFLLFAFLLLLAVAVILVIVLAIKPKKPQFDLQSVRVQYLGINPTPAAQTPVTTATAAAAAASASVSLTILMLFSAVNDNKVGIKYGDSKFTIMYRGIPLGRGIVPGFYQPAHSVRRVQTTISVDRVNLLQADAADLLRDATVNDRVELRVAGDVGAKIRILGFTSPGVEVSIFTITNLPSTSLLLLCTVFNFSLYFLNYSIHTHQKKKSKHYYLLSTHLIWRLLFSLLSLDFLHLKEGTIIFL